MKACRVALRLGIFDCDELAGKVMARKMWVCDSCGKGNDRMPWGCPGCGSETCERCFWTFAHCRACAEGKSPESLRLAANLSGFEFEPDAMELYADSGSRTSVATPDNNPIAADAPTGDAVDHRKGHRHEA